MLTADEGRIRLSTIPVCLRERLLLLFLSYFIINFYSLMLINVYDLSQRLVYL